MEVKQQNNNNRLKETEKTFARDSRLSITSSLFPIWQKKAVVPIDYGGDNHWFGTKTKINIKCWKYNKSSQNFTGALITDAISLDFRA